MVENGHKLLLTRQYVKFPYMQLYEPIHEFKTLYVDMEREQMFFAVVFKNSAVMLIGRVDFSKAVRDKNGHILHAPAD